MGVEGCDTIYTLTLRVVENDTIVMEPVSVNADKLPYVIDEFFTIPADMEEGTYEENVKVEGECAYRKYVFTINPKYQGLLQISDDVESIEVYDALGRKVRTLRHGDVQPVLPNGVYMLRTIMKSGQVVNDKVTLK